MSSKKRYWCALLILLGSLAMRSLTVPRSLWEFDEVLFTEGVLKFDPLQHHPHPPGYPLTIGLGKLVNVFVGEPFKSLLIVSLIGSAVATSALFLAVEALTGDLFAAFAAAILYRCSAGVLVHSPLALSDAPALMFVGVAVLAATKLRGERANLAAIVFGLSIAGAIGCRPQFAVPLVPLFFLAMILFWSRGVAVRMLIAMTVGCLLWLVPLIAVVGGPRGFERYEVGQAKYVAAHDAKISRSGYGRGQLLSRFLTHPFGPKWIAIPLLLLAMYGFAFAPVPWRFRFLFGLLASIQLAFCLMAADPADGVRYMLPAVLGWSLLAALGLWAIAKRTGLRVLSLAGSLVIGVASIAYCWPILATRQERASPIVQAAIWAEKNLPHDAVILYPTSLRPHAQYLFRRFAMMPTEAGLHRYATSARPVYRLVDGPAADRISPHFAWPASDAYRKLTRNSYRVISVVEMPRSDRFVPLEGVFHLENDANGAEWRWLAPNAELRLAGLPQRVSLMLVLPLDAPLERNRVQLLDGARVVATVDVRRGEGVRIDVPISGVNLRFRAERSFIPSQQPEKRNADPRRLAIELRALRAR